MSFDYSSFALLEKDISFLEHKALDISIYSQQVSLGILKTGKALCQAREVFGGNDKAFGKWRQARLPFLHRNTALNYMKVYKKFGDKFIKENNCAVEKAFEVMAYYDLMVLECARVPAE